jgi:hypothetical protein
VNGGEPQLVEAGVGLVHPALHARLEHAVALLVVWKSEVVVTFVRSPRSSNVWRHNGKATWRPPLDQRAKARGRIFDIRPRGSRRSRA